MNKKIITPLIGLALLAGCGASSGVSGDSNSPETTQYTPPSTAYVSPAENYLNGLSYDYPSEVSILGEAKAIELGKLTCQAIDEGSTIADFANMATSNDIEPGFIGAMIREAVENFCPENQWFINSALNA